MRRLILIGLLVCTASMISSSTYKAPKAEDIFSSLDNLEKSVIKLDSVLKHGKVK